MLAAGGGGGTVEQPRERGAIVVDSGRVGVEHGTCGCRRGHSLSAALDKLLD